MNGYEYKELIGYKFIERYLKFFKLNQIITLKNYNIFPLTCLLQRTFFHKPSLIFADLFWNLKTKYFAHHFLTAVNYF